MLQNIPKGALIAGGLALTGGIGFMLWKGSKGDKEAEAPAPAPTDPAAQAPGTMGPTAATPSGTAPGSSGLPAGAQQVGPYTIIPDPQSGQQVVFETATQQPVGVLDAQGNLLPLDGSGSASGSATSGTPGTQTGAPGTQTGTPGTQTGAPGTQTGIPSSGAGVPQAQASQAEYAAVAKQLFANAGNPAVGAASSDAMNGANTISPTATTGTPGTTGTTGLGTPGTAGTPATGTPGTGQITSTQQGEFTILDDGSGMKVIVETATQTPVGVMDAAGAITPLVTDANGNVSIAGEAITGAATGASTLTGTGTSMGVPATGTPAVGAPAVGTPAVGSPIG